jgi:hypothetical protein
MYFCFDGENISFVASLVLYICIYIYMYVYIYIYIYISNISPSMIINRIYENQMFLLLQLIPFLIGLRTYQHRCIALFVHTPISDLLGK